MRKGSFVVRGFQWVWWFFRVALVWGVGDECLDFVYVAIHNGVWNFGLTFGFAGD